MTTSINDGWVNTSRGKEWKFKIVTNIHPMLAEKNVRHDMIKYMWVLRLSSNLNKNTCHLLVYERNTPGKTTSVIGIQEQRKPMILLIEGS